MSGLISLAVQPESLEVGSGSSSARQPEHLSSFPAKKTSSSLLLLPPPMDSLIEGEGGGGGG